MGQGRTAALQEAQRKAKALAKRLGCELQIDRRHQTITIHLPEGKQIEGNPGLNIRVNNCETMDEVWECTLDDLRFLDDDGMEPIEQAPGDDGDIAVFVDRRMAQWTGMGADETPREYASKAAREILAHYAAAQTAAA